VVYQDEVICCYGRYPLVVVGNGEATIRASLDATEALYTQAGRPPAIDLNDHRIADTLRRQGYTLDTILPQNVSAKIYDSANLSIGGTARDFSDLLHPQWQQFAIDLVRKFNLTVCGLDFCCGDITQPDSIYSLLELNGTPTLSGYATLGETEYQRVRQFYRRIITYKMMNPYDKSYKPIPVSAQSTNPYLYPRNAAHRVPGIVSQQPTMSLCLAHNPIPDEMPLSHSVRQQLHHCANEHSPAHECHKSDVWQSPVSQLSYPYGALIHPVHPDNLYRAAVL
jgi:hypothetical protein